MKFTPEVAEVLQTVDDHIVYCNLPPQMIQHWTHAHEPSSYLIELVHSLSIGRRAAMRPLNPSALAHVHQQKKPIANAQDYKDLQNLKGEWKEVRNGHKNVDERQHANSHKNNACKNRCEVLQSEDEEQFKASEETNVKKIKSCKAEGIDMIKQVEADGHHIKKVNNKDLEEQIANFMNEYKGLEEYATELKTDNEIIAS